MTTLALKPECPELENIFYLLQCCSFSLSTMFAYPYYGVKCLGFVAGAKYGKYYYYFYAASILIAATTQLKVVISLIDLAFGLMAFPTVYLINFTCTPCKTSGYRLFFTIESQTVLISYFLYTMEFNLKILKMPFIQTDTNWA
jgi:Na+/alanine symporter